MHRLAACGIALLTFARHARADLFDRVPPRLLVGSFGGGHSGGRGPHGWFAGVDTGWAWLLGTDDVAARTTGAPHEDAWCFGARAGYQLRSGLALQARYDHLGVTSPDGTGRLSFAAFGLRYGFPSEIEPFAEAMIGPAFHGSEVSPAAAIGVGASVLATRHLTFDLALRDWLVDAGGIHHAPTATLGLTAGFGG